MHSPLNPPTLGDFEPGSPQNWGARGAIRVAVGTFPSSYGWRSSVGVLLPEAERCNSAIA
ncbi:MAG: hypothetical protein HC833_08455 [Leptolyngbyaceae cyanobacterium RM1_406_9]|nr:hypothetical protein [Leptolyngbyaceae cyanobacterium RM1_406_9]